jgi:ankyrin repeat protein
MRLAIVYNSTRRQLSFREHPDKALINQIYIFLFRLLLMGNSRNEEHLLTTASLDTNTINAYHWSGDVLTNPNCLESTTGHRWTPLHAAVHHGDVQLVKYLIQYGAIVVKDASIRLPHEVPLWPDLANNADAKRGYQEAIQLIKSMAAGSGLNGAGAMYHWSGDILTNPNCRESTTGHRWTPLHAAVHHGDVWLVKYLLHNGAIVAKDASNRLPHEIPLWPDLANNADAKRGYQEAIQLIKNMAAGSGLNGAGAMYHWSGDILTNPNCRESTTGHCWTPLHAAVHHGDAWLVEYLLHNGAVVERDAKNRLPHEIPLWPELANNETCRSNYQKAIQLTRAAPQPAAVSATPPNNHHKRKKHHHGFKKVFHQARKTVNHIVSPVNHVAHVVTKVTSPLAKPLQKAITPVVAPIAKVVAPINKIVAPVNKVLEPINALLTPVSIVATGGTIQAAVMALVKEQVINRVMAPVTNLVNHVTNPVNALISDVAQPVAPILSAVGNTILIATKVEAVAAQFESKATVTNEDQNNQQDKPAKSQPEKCVDQEKSTEQTQPKQEKPSPSRSHKTPNQASADTQHELPTNDKVDTKKLTNTAPVSNDNKRVDTVAHPHALPLAPLKDGYKKTVTTLADEMVKDSQLTSKMKGAASAANKVHFGMVSSTFCIAEKLSQGNNIKAALVDCGGEQAKEAAKFTTEEVASHQVAKTAGKLFANTALKKTIGQTAGAIVGEVLFPDPAL